MQTEKLSYLEGYCLRRRCGREQPVVHRNAEKTHLQFELSNPEGHLLGEMFNGVRTMEGCNI